MPYKSDAQRKKFHAMEERGEISSNTVKEFDKASKGKKLPERVRPASKKKPIRSVEDIKKRRKEKFGY